MARSAWWPIPAIYWPWNAPENSVGAITLGGLISPMDGIGPDLLQISSLVKRVADDNIDEVILALTPSVEGDTTSRM